MLCTNPMLMSGSIKNGGGKERFLDHHSSSLGLRLSANPEKALAQIGAFWSEADGLFVLLARLVLFTEFHVNPTQ